MHDHHHKHPTKQTSGSKGTTQSSVSHQGNACDTQNGKDQKHGVTSDEAIRFSAFQKWESAGKPDGDGSQFWLEAEQELTRTR